MPRTPQEIKDELMERAAAKEDNIVHPGQPTLSGIVAVLIEEAVAMRQAVEEVKERDS
jgi:hypothetical protein